MAELPIAFTAPMVLASYACRKNQTRRTIAQPTIEAVSVRKTAKPYVWEYVAANGATEPVRVKYEAGDICYIREAWRTFISLNDVAPRDLYVPGERGAGVWFEADGGGLALTSDGLVSYGPREDKRAFGRLRAGMHLPKVMSRATIVIDEVRVERLQDISEADAKAEGTAPNAVDDRGYIEISPTYRNGYRTLWNSINGAGSWATNPFIAVYRFRFFPRNINDSFMEG